MSDAPSRSMRARADAARIRHFDTGGNTSGTLDRNIGDPDYWPTGAPGDMARATPNRDQQEAGGFERFPLGVEHPEYGGERIINPYGHAQPTGYGSGYGSRWHLEVVHANGRISPLPLRQTSSGAGQTHWTSDYQLQAGDQVRAVAHNGTIIG